MDNYDKIKNDSSYIKNLSKEEQTNKLCWLALVINPSNIQWIHNQTTNKIRYVLKKDPLLIKYIKLDNRTHGFCRSLIIDNINIFHDIIDIHPYIARWVIKNYPDMFHYIKSDHHDYNKICEIALLKNYKLYKNMKNVNMKTILNVLKKNYRLFKLIDKKDRTDEIYRIASKRSPYKVFKHLDKEEYTLEILKYLVTYTKFDSVEDGLKTIAVFSISDKYTWFPNIKEPSYNVYMALVEKGKYFYNKYISLDYLSDDKIMYILNKNGGWIRNMTESRITTEFSKIAVMNANVLSYIPSKLIDYELCSISVKYYGHSIFDVPPNIIDRNLVRIAALNACDIIRYDRIKKFLDYDLYLEVASSGQHKQFLRYIPIEILDEKICYEAVASYASNIRYVPNYILTHSICLKSVENYGMGILEIPNNFINQEIVEKAFNNYHGILSMVNKKYHTKNMWKQLLSQNTFHIGKCPKEYLDNEFLLDLFSNSIVYSPDKSPDEFISKFDDYEFCKKAIEINPNIIVHIKYNKFYDLWIESAKRCAITTSRLISELNIHDEYLYLISFNNKKLCDKCNSSRMFKIDRDLHWYRCWKCYGNDNVYETIETNIAKENVKNIKTFFKKVQLCRILAYIKFAKINNINSSDEVLQYIINNFTFDIIKIIILQMYDYRSDTYIREASLNLIMDKMSFVKI